MSRPPFDLSALFKQAQELQSRLAGIQERLRHRTVEATVGGGAVAVTANARLELVSVRVDPELVDPGDLDMLQDLFVAAANEALRRAQEIAREEFRQATGLPLPDFMGGSG